MERTVITLSAENTATIFLMVAGTTATIGLFVKMIRKWGAAKNG